MSTTTPPRAFVSYSWTTPSHEQWVLDLATELRSCGVEIVFDKWDLKEGHDKHAFMERMVTDKTVTKVLMICDRVYAEKADARSGGVGTETQIITPELYGKTEQDRFVAVVVQKDNNGNPFVPSFYKSRIHIDMSTEDLRAANFERLLRWIFDKPLNEKPALGRPPAFLHEDGTRGTTTETAARRTVDAFRNGKPIANGSLREYLDALAATFEGFRLPPSGGNDTFDEHVITSIDRFTPIRDEFLGVLDAATHYGIQATTVAEIQQFLDLLVPNLTPQGPGPPRSGIFHRWDADNLLFIGRELFLHTIAMLVRARWYEGVGSLTTATYMADNQAEAAPLKNFGVFCQPLDAFTHRNQRLKKNRLSLLADVLKERCASGPVKFDELMQADYLLFLADAVHSLREERPQNWFPETLVFQTLWQHPFPVFLRATSRKSFDLLKVAIGVANREELATVVEAFAARRLRVPTWQYDSISPAKLMSWETLATRA